MSETHPDILTDKEAAAYLRLTGPRSMDTVARKYRLLPLDMPGPRTSHRADLDDAVQEARGRDNVARGPKRLQINDGVA